MYKDAYYPHHWPPISVKRHQTVINHLIFCMIIKFVIYVHPSPILHQMDHIWQSKYSIKWMHGSDPSLPSDGSSALDPYPPSIKSHPCEPSSINLISPRNPYDPATVAILHHPYNMEKAWGHDHCGHCLLQAFIMCNSNVPVISRSSKKQNMFKVMSTESLENNKLITESGYLLSTITEVLDVIKMKKNCIKIDKLIENCDNDHESVYHVLLQSKTSLDKTQKVLSSLEKQLKVGNMIFVVWKICYWNSQFMVCEHLDLMFVRRMSVYCILEPIVEAQSKKDW